MEQFLHEMDQVFSMLKDAVSGELIICHQLNVNYDMAIVVFYYLK